MRQHFYKGYSISQKRMLTPEELAYVGVYIGIDGKLNTLSDIKLLAYTGRQDINGRPIFELDIVDFNVVTSIDEMPITQRVRGIVKWHVEAGFWTMEDPQRPPKEGDELNWTAESVVVVGNQLPNPTLLSLPPIYGNPMERTNKPKEA